VFFFGFVVGVVVVLGCFFFVSFLFFFFFFTFLFFFFFGRCLRRMVFLFPMFTAVFPPPSRTVPKGHVDGRGVGTYGHFSYLPRLVSGFLRDLFGFGATPPAFV